MRTERIELEKKIQDCVSRASNRFELWANLLEALEIQNMVEVGVYRGDFAARMLNECDRITKYYMIDPWRHLDDWNKPSNRTNEDFEEILSEALAKTDFADERRIVLRGKTSEVVNEIEDEEVDFAYIDGDHTLRGITIDLIRILPKIRSGGFVGGDDLLSRSVWQNPTSFEPTLVYPYTLYFAEAVGARLYALPYLQFLMVTNSAFEFIDLTDSYSDTVLRAQFHPVLMLKLKLGELFPRARNLMWRLRDLLISWRKSTPKP